MICRSVPDIVSSLKFLYCVFIVAECCYSWSPVSPIASPPKTKERLGMHTSFESLAPEKAMKYQKRFEKQTQFVEDCGKRHHDGVSRVDVFAALTGRSSSISTSITEVSKFDHIVLGRNAGWGKWPWMALVFIRGDDGMKWQCGGSLVSTKHVLTAAHCVAGVSRRPDMVMVRLGEYRISSILDGKREDIMVDAVILHPENNANQADIALLVLEKHISLTETLAALCLPAAGSSPDAGSDVMVAGWGRRMFDDFNGTDVLQAAKLQLVDADDCEQSYQGSNSFDKFFPNGFQNAVLCAIGQQNQDACRGDSGGPLVQLIDGRYYLVGIVSTGAGCGNPDYPGIYTKVAHFKDWILVNGIM